MRENNVPDVSQDIEAMICWFDDSPMQQPRGKYTIVHTTAEARCIVKEVRYTLDINTLHRNQEDTKVKMNDIARVALRTTKPLFTDEYRTNRITGSFILVDEGTNNTVAAGMVI